MGKPELSKICPVCNSNFSKPWGYGKQRWEARLFCSHKCASTKIHFNKDSIPYLYVVYKLSSSEIGKEFGISGKHVLRILKEKGVKTRGASENKKLSSNRPEAVEKMKMSATGRRLSESAKVKLRALTGAANAQWRGGLTMSANGYLQFTASPANGCNAGKMIHKVIAEWKYARQVGNGEHIHHLDGNKLNNHPENIVIISASDHAKIHYEDRENGKRLKHLARNRAAR